MYTEEATANRAEFSEILEMVPERASVVDLGCGEGSLLHLLRTKKGCQVIGIELSPSGAAACRKKGIETIQGRIDEPLSSFKDSQFDVVICNATLHMVMYPEIVLSEMKRIARSQIVTFPNFAFIRNRFDLLFRGRMPRPMLFGYDWFSTGHIHQFSIHDFLEVTARMGFSVISSKCVVADGSKIKRCLAETWPNLFSTVSIFYLGSSS